MKFNLKIKQKVVVISINSEITTFDKSQELIAAIQTELAKNNKNFIFDLGNVNHLNSAGINVLITALTAIRNKEGELVLAAISDKVKSLLVTTKLNSIFKVKNSIKESLQYINTLVALEED